MCPSSRRGKKNTFFFKHSFCQNNEVQEKRNDAWLQTREITLIVELEPSGVPVVVHQITGFTLRGKHDSIVCLSEERDIGCLFDFWGII